MSRIEAHGLRADLPARWEARLYLRQTPTATAADARAAAAHGTARTAAHPAAVGWHGDVPNPVLHLANFALPPGRGDFGTGAVERMGVPHVFVSLFEYDRAEAGRPLFADRGLPRPRARDFGPNQLQRILPGQAGVQRFFTEHDRAFCLYVVLGSQRHVHERLPELHRALDGIRIGVR
ncbi:MAG: hypothetical protein ACTHMS_13740 [Jatrophihabitans sp.]|uniref:hypothetical protein n=1 Tax=Jatrophihabitans sp. TaxID=1932789 RepID=UPI003F80716F